MDAGVTLMDENPTFSGRLFIVDPSLNDLRGHHYQLTLNADLAAKQNKIECHWLVNRSADPALLAQHPEAKPVFSGSMYDRYRSGGNGAASLSDEMRDGILEAIEGTDISERDRLFFHTCDGATYQAMADLAQLLDLDQMPSFHLCTPYDPWGVMPNREHPSQVTEAINMLGFMGLIGTKVFLYAENDLLAEHLTRHWRTPVQALNLPLPEFSDDDLAAAAAYREDTLGLKTGDVAVGVLGSARVEKGFHLLPDIVERSREFADRFGLEPRQVHFIIQATPQIVGREPVIQRAIDRLNDLADPSVHILEHSLSVEEYQNVLLGSDIILMPYDVSKYKVRGSGVVSEALAAGKLAVATTGSYPGWMASQFGGTTAETPREFAEAILELCSRPKEELDETQRRLAHFRETNRPLAYFRRFAERDEPRPLSLL